MHRRKYKVSKYSHVGWIQCKSLRQNGDSRMILDVKSVTSSIGRCLIVKKRIFVKYVEPTSCWCGCRSWFLNVRLRIHDTYGARYQCLSLCWRRIHDTSVGDLGTSQICMRRIWNSISIEYHRSTCTRTTLHSVCVIDREYMTLIQYHTSIHDVQDPSLCQAGTSYRREVIVVLRYEVDARYNSVV